MISNAAFLDVQIRTVCGTEMVKLGQDGRGWETKGIGNSRGLITKREGERARETEISIKYKV